MATWPKRYTKQVRLAKLHDELIVAGLPPITIEGALNGSYADLTYAETQAAAPVDSIVNAHNAATPSVIEAQEEQDGIDIADWKNTINSMLGTAATDKTEIIADLVTLNSKAWDSLTPAERTAGIRRMAVRQQHIITGMERILKAVKVIARRAG